MNGPLIPGAIPDIASYVVDQVKAGFRATHCQAREFQTLWVFRHCFLLLLSISRPCATISSYVVPMSDPPPILHLKLVQSLGTILWYNDIHQSSLDIVKYYAGLTRSRGQSPGQISHRLAHPLDSPILLPRLPHRHYVAPKDKLAHHFPPKKPQFRKFGRDSP